MGSVQFQIVPCCSLYFCSRSIRPFQCLVSANYRVLICCTCEQSAIKTSRAVASSLFISASSVGKSLQCLISALTQGGQGGHLFRLTCSVVLWGGKNTANISLVCMGSARSVWTTLGLPQLTAHVLSQSTLLRLHVVLHGSCPKRALGFVHFPGLSCSGSDSQVLHKGTDSVGLAFCALPRPRELRPPVLGEHTVPGRLCILITSLVPASWFPGYATRVLS